MSRFIAPDLSRLPKLPLQRPDFETILEERLADFEERSEGRFNVSNIDGDPIVINERVGADREVEVRSDHNDKVKAVLLAKAWGSYLDHIAATYYGISRLTMTGEDGEITYEEDDDFRARIALAPEAFSTAGPEGAYVFHALELDGVRDISDAAAYSEEDGALYSDTLHADAYSAGLRPAPFANRATGDPVLAPEILIVVLPTLEYGVSNQSLMDRTFEALSGKEVRPLGDTARIEAADITDYQITAVLKFAAGADPQIIADEATIGVNAYVAARRRIGAIVQMLGIAAAMKVADVVELEITTPAADIDPGSKGAAQCTDITITTQIAEGSWRATP